MTQLDGCLSHPGQAARPRWCDLRLLSQLFIRTMSQVICLIESSMRPGTCRDGWPRPEARAEEAADGDQRAGSET